MTALGALRYELDEKWLAEQRSERVCRRTWPTSHSPRLKLPISASLYQKMWVLLLICYDAGDDTEYMLV